MIKISHLKSIGALVALVVATAQAWAVPALRKPITVTQPDGTTLTITRVGDEFAHFTLTDDRKLVVEDADGQYSYGRVTDQGNVKSTGIKAYDAKVRPASQRYLTQSIDDIDMAKFQKARATAVNSATKPGMRRAVPQSGMGRFTSNYPRTGNIKGIIILAEYADVKFNTGYVTSPHDYFSNMMMKKNFNEYGGTGSAVDYFLEQSWGKFNPQFDVYGPVTLSQNRSYYGGNDSYDNDQAPEEMIVEACKLANQQYADLNFADYDNDGDGVLDNVFVFYAGQGEASYGPASSVWPHSYDVRYGGFNQRIDGVLLASYACTNEWEQSNPDGVGTFIHEFSHVMGLPDLYCTGNGSGEWTPGSYSVLDYGPYNNNGRTPPCYSIYERNAMGWIDPQLLDGPEAVTLKPIQDANKGCIIQVPGQNTEFFLFENRQQKGWDTYLPNHGMLIWHIDFSQSVWDQNAVNNTKSHQYVDIIEANSSPFNNNPASLQGWTWPGTSGKTEFTATTTPKFKAWSGATLNDLPITDIQEDSQGLIHFNVAGGSSLARPAVTQPTDIGGDYFVATWKAVDGASDYQLTVMTTVGETPMDETADMGSTTLKLPEGWATDVTTVYTTNSNYGEASPSMKMSATGNYLTSRLVDTDISKITFWHKGMNVSTSGSSLAVEGRTGADAEWQLLATVLPVNLQGNTAEIDVTIPGIRQIRITYTKVSGNVGVDDVHLIGGGEFDELVTGYENVATAGATQMRVGNLNAAHSSRYKYAVTAVNADGERSRQSEWQSVTLTNGVDDIIVDGTDGASALTVAINGRTIDVTAQGAKQADIYDAMGRHVSTRALTDGQASLTLPAAGIYIVHANRQAVKVIVH